MTKHSTRREMTDLIQILDTVIYNRDGAGEFGFNQRDVDKAFGDLLSYLQKKGKALHTAGHDYKPDRNGTVWSIDNGEFWEGTIAGLLLHVYKNRPDDLDYLMDKLMYGDFSYMTTDWRFKEMNYKDEARRLINRVIEGSSVNKVLDELDVYKEVTDWNSLVVKYRGLTNNPSYGRVAKFRDEKSMTRFLDAVEKDYPNWMTKLDFPDQNTVVLKVK